MTAGEAESLGGLQDRIEDLEEELKEKAAHPLELFFDLVFVFAITQVVSLVVLDLTLAGILRGALVLALMWWAWTNWTWTTNVVDLEPRVIRVAVLTSMLGVFGMAFAVPTAFQGDSHWILIIALGEGIIAVGVALEGTQIDKPLVFLLAVGLAGVCAMWWAYFDRLQEVMETALRLADTRETGHIARDVYSLLHYPMVAGIVFYAVALEEAFLHPNDPMGRVVATLFVVAVGLYLLAQAIAVWRCWRTYLYERVIGVVAIALIVAVWDGAAKDVVLVATVVLIATLTTEYLRFRSRIRGEVPDPETAAA